MPLPFASRSGKAHTNLMKRVRYTKYEGGLAGEMSMEDLLNALSDYLLDSGFQNPWMEFSDLDHTMDALRDALKRALESGELFDEDMQQQIDEMSAEGKLDELIEQLMQRMEQENFISVDSPQNPSQSSSGPGQVGDNEGEVRFEVTDKSLDFLGFKTLRDLLGSLGKSNYGRHDTRHWATGIEASGASKQYEFGDTLNLDTVATLTSAIAREGISLPLNM
jgi:Ca-activated chloride channel family protein